MTEPPALYVRDGDGYHATAYTRGPWDPRHQHAGPPSALLAREAARASELIDGQFARMTFDILRPIPRHLVHVQARVLRPGRRVEQVVGELTSGGEPLMRLSAWRMRREAVELPEHLQAIEPPPPAPETVPEGELPFFGDGIGYGDALEWRLISGAIAQPGPAAVWTRMRVSLVEDEPIAPVEHLLVMSDAASGVSATLDWQRYTFLNVDYSLHLERVPEGEWMAMDAVTRPGPGGMGQCTAVLSDTRGRLGVSTQSLLVAAR